MGHSHTCTVCTLHSLPTSIHTVVLLLWRTTNCPRRKPDESSKYLCVVFACELRTKHAAAECHIILRVQSLVAFQAMATSVADRGGCRQCIKKMRVLSLLKWLLGQHRNLSRKCTRTAQDLALFLLTRGPYAFFGYGWSGCVSPDGSHPFTRPSELDVDYGVPTSDCSETSPGVFERGFRNAHVAMDCNSFNATIMPGG